MIDRGRYVIVDGRPAVRFERVYRHPVEKVWNAVSRPEGLAAWFPSTVTIEPRVGGEIAFGGDPHLRDQTGTVLVYDPPRTLAFTWGGDELRFTVEPIGQDEARLVLINILETGEAAARNAAGWHVCLAELEKTLAGERTEGPHGDSAIDWQPVYARYVADGLPSGAPIPEG